jgi:integrase
MKSKNEESSKLKISYQLKTEKSPLKPVIAFINFGHKEIDLLTRKVTYKPLIISTGIKLLPADWNAELKMPNKIEDRNQIYEIHRNIVIVYDKLIKKGAIDFDEFKEELEERILGKEKKETVVKVRLVDFIRENIVAANTIKKTSKSPYKNLIGKLEEYERQIGKFIYSKDVNEEMYLNFIEFYRPYAERINAVWAIQKVFKAVLKEIARFYKIKVFDPATELSNRDKIQAENADAVYLDMDQIQMIIDFDPEDDRLYNVKYIFMILLFTGCRESDVYKIIPEAHHSVKGTSFNYCRYITQKTVTEIICPILKPLQDMFDENKGKPPRKIAQQKLNSYVKELALKSGLDQDVSTTYTDSTGKKKKITKKLYQFISSHTGRRSFITNLINFIPLPTLTKITGHKLQDKSIIFAYNKMTLLENAVMFCNQLRRATEENHEYFPFSLVD